MSKNIAAYQLQALVLPLMGWCYAYKLEDDIEISKYDARAFGGVPHPFLVLKDGAIVWRDRSEKEKEPGKREHDFKKLAMPLIEWVAFHGNTEDASLTVSGSDAFFNAGEVINSAGSYVQSIQIFGNFKRRRYDYCGGFDGAC